MFEGRQLWSPPAAVVFGCGGGYGDGEGGDKWDGVVGGGAVAAAGGGGAGCGTGETLTKTKTNPNMCRKD